MAGQPFQTSRKAPPDCRVGGRLRIELLNLRTPERHDVTIAVPHAQVFRASVLVGTERHEVLEGDVVGAIGDVDGRRAIDRRHCHAADLQQIPADQFRAVAHRDERPWRDVAARRRRDGETAARERRLERLRIQILNVLDSARVLVERTNTLKQRRDRPPIQIDRVGPDEAFDLVIGTDQPRAGGDR